MFRLSDDAKKGSFLFVAAGRKKSKSLLFGRQSGLFSRCNETYTIAPLTLLRTPSWRSAAAPREGPIIHKYARTGTIVRYLRFDTPLACTEIQCSN